MTQSSYFFHAGRGLCITLVAHLAPASVRTSLSALFLPSPRAHLSRQLNSASFGLCGSLPLENKRISGLTSLLQPARQEVR